MNSTGQIFVTAVLLIGILLFAPASARTVADGGTIFEYEEGLDLSAMIGDGDDLTMFEDDNPEKGALSIIHVTDASSLDLTDLDLDGHYGLYYGVSEGVPNGRTVFILEPRISIDLVPNNDHALSFAGRSVPNTMTVAFLIDAPEVGVHLPDATVRVELTTAGGTTISGIGGQDLTGHRLVGAESSIDDLDLRTLPVGTYTARAVWESPDGFYDYAEESNAISFTVVPSDARVVEDQGTVFAYEEHVDLSAMTQNGGQMVMYASDNPESAPVFSFEVSDSYDLDLTTIDLKGNYGRYFGINRDGAATGSSVYIRKPEVSLGVVLDRDPETSVEGKTVSSTSPLRFVLQAPYVGRYLSDASVRIELTGPTGAKITSVGDCDLTGHVLNGSTTSIDGVEIETLNPGVYTARAVWETPEGFAAYATPSNAVSFTIVPSNARVIEDQGVVFAYEESVDVSAVTQSGGRLVMYVDDDPALDVVSSIPVSDAANLDLTCINLRDHYGRYSGVLRDGTVTSRYVNIRNPVVYLDVQLASEPYSSISGASVPANMLLRFRIDAPEVGVYLPDATVRVELTAPGGAKLTALGGRDLTGHVLDGSTTYIDNVDISALEPGAYSARVVWESPDGFADYALDSDPVAFTVFPSTVRKIGDGDAVFLYEKSVDVSAVVGNGGKLVKYTDDVPGHEVIYEVQVPEAADLDLAAVALHGNDGKFFGVEKDGRITGKYVFIREPAVSLDVALESDQAFSLADAVVARDKRIQFVFDAPEVGPVLKTATVRVELISPDGVTATSIGDRSLRGHLLDSARTSLSDIDISTLGVGKYGARAVWESPEGFATSAMGSGWVNFTVSLRDLEIHSNKDVLTRNHPFTIVVSGESKAEYYLYIKNIDDSPTGYPSIKPDQPGVTIRNSPFTGAADPAASALANSERAGAPATAAVITTDADGRRVIGFETDATTQPATYEIRVVDPACASNVRQASVKVEPGEASIVAEDTGTYFFGEKITLSGKITDGDYVYLFVTGPGLGDSHGVALDDATAPASQGHHVVADVMADDNWTYQWNTSALSETGALSGSGTYTVYAASADRDADGNSVDSAHLNGVTNATVALVMEMPSLAASVDPVQVVQGDAVSVCGTATGHLDDVRVWVIGEDVRVFNESAIGPDGTFAYSIAGTVTEHYGPGLYAVVVQHPMFDGTFNVRPEPAEGKPYQIRDASGNVIDLGALPAPETLRALKEALDSPACDDIYVDLSFLVGETGDEAWIWINALEDRSVGDYILVSGTTNLPAGGTLTYAVAPALADPGAGSASGTTVVAAGLEANMWSFVVDTTGFSPEQYQVTVESPDHLVRQSTTFDLRAGPFVPVSGNTLTLQSGWNFISVPKVLSAGNNTAAIFSGVNTAGHSILRYDPAKGMWAAMKPDDEVRPLDGIWIYSQEKMEITLSFSTEIPAPMAERALQGGWNAVGFSDLEPATTRDCLLSLKEKWTTLIGFDASSQTFRASIIRGGSGTHRDSGLMYPGCGYWLYMTEPGTLCAIST